MLFKYYSLKLFRSGRHLGIIEESYQRFAPWPTLSSAGLVYIAPRAKRVSLHTIRPIMAVVGPVPSIVGALLCQKDSYLRTLETEVISCEEYISPKAAPASGKPKAKKGSDAAKATEDASTTAPKTWLIELADSVLFPEGKFRTCASLDA